MVKRILLMIVISISPISACELAQLTYQEAITKNQSNSHQGIDISVPNMIENSWDLLVIDVDLNGYLGLDEFKFAMCEQNNQLAGSI